MPGGAVQLPLPQAEPGSGLGDDLRRREFQMIIDTLRAERGRRKEAAERLGISPRTLRYKLAQMRDAGMDVEPVVDLGVDSSVGVVTLEPIVVRNLKHTVLVKVGKTDVVVGSSFVPGY